jgi:4-amino-4-deoxy-L-arabinose transferase-like glycosyltransferase
VFPVLLLLAVVVLGTGLVLPHLVTQDSSRDAVMAMRMHLDRDWVHLVKDGQPYLDKPHLLFWSAMAGYRLFGIHEWSYRLGSVLVTLLGGWSVFGLARRLHGATVGKMAAVMFLTAYQVVVSNHDVRMDALLTGFVAFALWQLVRYLDTGDARPLALGAAGLGLAFSAKGMIAVAAVGASVLFRLWSRREWRRLFTWKVLLAAAVFAATISPVLYAYHLQYDLHPELVVGGRTGVSGVKFILLGQSVERFGGGMGDAHTGDALFLYHSLLWAFLPWSLLVFAGWFTRLRELVRGRWAAFHARDQMSFLGVFVPVAVLSFSRYKLAHYLDVFFPLLAVFAAGWLEELHRTGRVGWLAGVRRLQTALVVGVLGWAAILNGWAFPPRSGWVIAGVLVFAGALALAFRLPDRLARAWVPSAVAISLLGFAQNASYQPAIGEAQLGAKDAPRLLAQELDWSRTFFLDINSHPLQFYTQRVIPQVPMERVRSELADGRPVYLLVAEPGRAQVQEAGLAAKVREEFSDCRLLKLNLKVLNPATRDRAACRKVWLLEVRG